VKIKIFLFAGEDCKTGKVFCNLQIIDLQDFLKFLTI